MRTRLLLRLSLISFLFIVATVARASSSAAASAEENTRGFSYVELKPPFIVNVGQSGKIGFLKADVSLRVESAAVASVEHHMPAIRHELIMLLSRQSPETLQSPEGREELRLAGLEAVRHVVEELDHVEGVTDLLFTSFLVQR